MIVSTKPPNNLPMVVHDADTGAGTESQGTTSPVPSLPIAGTTGDTKG